MMPISVKQGPQVRAGKDVSGEFSDTILVIGEVLAWAAKGQDITRDKGIKCIDLHELSAELLELYQPQAVFSPLLCSSFDCLDVAFALQEIGFRGRYRAMSSDLPAPHLIRKEISEHCPDIDFDIVIFSEEIGAKLN